MWFIRETVSEAAEFLTICFSAITVEQGAVDVRESTFTCSWWDTRLLVISV